MGKKVVYKVKAEDSTFFVAAINSAEDDYHLAWLLNNNLKTKLVRTEHLTDSTEQTFPAFFYLDEVGGISYTLASNKIGASHLLPQLKNVDYIFKISGTLTDNFQAETLSKIRSLREITACILIKSGPPSLLNFFRNL
ncbi:MAG: IPExxxVDY family protein [Prevotellaceae bacterium]|jgi:hypothetical protein|nr:IPExxxVDY family protein [Prevotellaceae bacterium]